MVFLKYVLYFCNSKFQEFETVQTLNIQKTTKFGPKKFFKINDHEKQKKKEERKKKKEGKLQKPLSSFFELYFHLDVEMNLSL